MALVSSGFFLTVQFVDTGKNTTQRRFALTSIDIATAIIDSGIILAAVGAVTNAVISGYNISEAFTENALVLPVDTEIEKQAQLSLLLAGLGTKTAVATIPAPVAGIFTDVSGPGYNVVDVSDAGVLAYVNIYKAGGQATISDGEIADKLLSGRRISVKSNRG